MRHPDQVSRHATLTPSRPALTFAGCVVTYAALDRLATRAATAFLARGVRPGDRVAIVLPNGPDFVVAYLGARRAGAIATSVSALWGEDAIGRALADADPALVVVREPLHEALGRPRALLSDVPLDHPHSLHDAVAAATPRATAWQARDDDAAAILYTSGTTGAPKGVMLAGATIDRNAARKAAYCGIGPTDRVALFVPLAHVFGQNAIMNATFAAGGCVALYERFDEERVAADARAGRLTMLFAPPPAYRRLLAAGLRRDAMGALRYAFSAAAPLAPEDRERWREATGLPLHEGYGLTESAPFAAYNHRERVVAGSVGTAIEGATIAAVDPASGHLLPAGEVGELAIRGGDVMLGYWRRPELTAAALRDGWLRTGDLGRVDGRGYVYLAGRLDDVINVSGHKVHPAEVETALAGMPEVAEACAFGVPDAARGERVEVALVPRPDCAIGEAELVARAMAAIAPRLAPYQRPARVHVRDALPRNPSGKVLRRALRADADSRHHTTPTT